MNAHQQRRRRPKAAHSRGPQLSAAEQAEIADLERKLELILLGFGQETACIHAHDQEALREGGPACETIADAARAAMFRP